MNCLIHHTAERTANNSRTDCNPMPQNLKPHLRGKRKLKNALIGFTLIEVMIVVAIIAILASIALPSYREYIVQSRRTDAQSALMEISQYMERQYTSGNAYPSSIPAALTSRTATYYTITLAGGSGAQAYVVQAAPTSAQSDSTCGTLSVSHTGAKTPGTAGCWK